MAGPVFTSSPQEGPQLGVELCVCGGVTFLTKGISRVPACIGGRMQILSIDRVSWHPPNLAPEGQGKLLQNHVECGLRRGVTLGGETAQISTCPSGLQKGAAMQTQ